MGGGSGGGSGPTLQQQQLETQQALTNANLNLEENSQRKSILNAMMGTRVFKGSALSRAMRGNTPGAGGVANAPAPSASQTNAGSGANVPTFTSLLDQRQSNATGSTPAGGAGTSATPSTGGGRIGGGGGSTRGPIR